jgi:hypothetical protein
MRQLNRSQQAVPTAAAVLSGREEAILVILSTEIGLKCCISGFTISTTDIQDLQTRLLQVNGGKDDLIIQASLLPGMLPA